MDLVNPNDNKVVCFGGLDGHLILLPLESLVPDCVGCCFGSGDLLFCWDIVVEVVGVCLNNILGFGGSLGGVAAIAAYDGGVCGRGGGVVKGVGAIVGASIIISSSSSSSVVFVWVIGYKEVGLDVLHVVWSLVI